MPLKQIITPFILEQSEKAYRNLGYDLKTQIKLTEGYQKLLAEVVSKSKRLNNILFVSIILNLLFALDVLIAVSPF